MLHAIEGLVNAGFLLVAHRRGDPINGIHFGAELSMKIRNDPVFRGGVTQTYGLGDALKQVDDRSTPKLKRTLVYVLLERDQALPAIALPYSEEELESASKTLLAH